MSKPTQLNTQRAESCGTCSGWVARGHDRYCPRIDHKFLNSHNLALYWCRQYTRDTVESYAVELYERLTHG